MQKSQFASFAFIKYLNDKSNILLEKRIIFADINLQASMTSKTINSETDNKLSFGDFIIEIFASSFKMDRKEAFFI